MRETLLYIAVIAFIGIFLASHIITAINQAGTPFQAIAAQIEEATK